MAADTPDACRHAVLYQCFVRQHGPNGTLAEVTADLPRIAGLGVTVLYLMPIHPIGEQNRKGTLGSPYAVRDYYGVNPEFGSQDDLKALVALRRAIRDFRPRVVHTHSSKAGVLGRLAARLERVPVVVHTVHGFGFTPLQSAVKRWLFFTAEKAAARWTDHFVTVSRRNLERGVELGLWAEDEASVIRAGIDLHRSTLADWVGKAAFHLAPIVDRLVDDLDGDLVVLAIGIDGTGAVLSVHADRLGEEPFRPDQRTQTEAPGRGLVDLGPGAGPDVVLVDGFVRVLVALVADHGAGPVEEPYGVAAFGVADEQEIEVELDVLPVLVAIGRLDFEAPDPARFPCLGHAYTAIRSGGTAPAILNAANEVAVQAFLDRRIPFLAIPELIGRCMEKVESEQPESIDHLLDVDRRARAESEQIIHELV